MKQSAPVLFLHNARGYSGVDVRRALRRVGVERGSDVFVHADLGSLGKMGNIRQRAEFVQAFIDALIAEVGTAGTIVMPTFTYSFCRGEVYDPRASASRVGLLGEYWRRQPGVIRSLDPIFSVAARGPAQAHYAVAGQECFGEDSVFAKLLARDVHILFIGETFDMTFIHYLERRHNVPYRFLKRFSGFINEAGQRRVASVLYFVRPRDGSVHYDLEALRIWLAQRGIVHAVELGASTVCRARARDVYEALSGELTRNDRFLLTVGQYAAARA